MSAIVGVLLILIVLGNGHIRWISPQPRSNANNLDSGGYCGGVDFNANQQRLSYQAGETITVQWRQEVTIYDGSEYRIALSRNGTDMYFDECILLNHIPEHTLGNTRTLSAEITLPNVKCEYCTLQVIQFLPSTPQPTAACCTWMEDGTSSCSGTSYRSCANIIIIGGSSIAHRNSLTQCSQPSAWDYRFAGACNKYKYSESNVHWLGPNNNDAILTINTNRAQDDVTTGCPDGINTCQGIIDITDDSTVNAILGGTPFANGGTMTAGGVIGIISLILIIVLITVTIFIVKKRQKGDNNTNANTL